MVVLILLLCCAVPLLHCCTLHEEHMFTGVNGAEYRIKDITDLGLAVLANDVDKIKKAMGNFKPLIIFNLLYTFLEDGCDANLNITSVQEKWEGEWYDYYSSYSPPMLLLVWWPDDQIGPALDQLLSQPDIGCYNLVHKCQNIYIDGLKATKILIFFYPLQQF